MELKEKIKKLPKWAQEYIQFLKNTIEEQEYQLKTYRNEGPDGIFVDRHQITFDLGVPKGIIVVIKRKDTLDIIGDPGGIVVKPMASNRVTISNL